MPKEVKMYEADDKKTFKTKSGAYNHNRKLAVKDAMKRLSMTEEEIESKLKEISERLPTVKMLLRNQSNWTKWHIHHIKLINEDLFKEPDKITQYVREYKDWGKLKEEVLFTETGVAFSDPELHCNNPILGAGDQYKVIKVDNVSSVIKKVYYDYKYDWTQRMSMKLKAGEDLSDSDINSLIYNFDEIHREEGEDRRWSKSVLSVVDIEGELYAIEWEQGLTENQENEFYNQPYPVELKTEEVVIKKTTVVKRELDNKARSVVKSKSAKK